MNIEQKIEAVLFFKNEPVEIKKLAKILNIDENRAREGLENLRQNLKDRGVCLIESGGEVALATAPEAKELIEQIAKDEMSKEIGKAGLETLAIILYNGSVSRREIDYIRGVNSTFVLRNLSIRGLIERDQSAGERGFKYKPTISLLAHLGLTNQSQLPDFEEMTKKIGKIFEENKNANDQ